MEQAGLSGQEGPKGDGWFGGQGGQEGLKDGEVEVDSRWGELGEEVLSYTHNIIDPGELPKRHREKALGKLLARC